MGTFHFLHPAWFLALPPLLGLAAWLAWRSAHEGTWSQLVDEDLLPAVRLKEGKRSTSPWLWVSLAWLLAVFALAGPSWQRRQVDAFRAPDAWVLVLDLSPSMGAADVAPDRVTRARYAIEDLLSAAHDARVGLVVFAGEAHTVAPLTTDIATVRVLLQPLAPGLMPESGDNLAPALDEAGRLLQASHSAGGQVIVLSDGIADPAQALLAAQRLRQRGTQVHLIGVGTTTGAPEPDGHGEFARDSQGHTQISRLQVDQLQRIAGAGGGRFVELSAVPRLVASLRADRPRAYGPGATGSATRVSSWRNGGIWLLPPLLLFAALLARRGWV
jgi:Ca-activated chloride channel homolog